MNDQHWSIGGAGGDRVVLRVGLSCPGFVGGADDEGPLVIPRISTSRRRNDVLVGQSDLLAGPEEVVVHAHQGRGVVDAEGAVVVDEPLGGEAPCLPGRRIARDVARQAVETLQRGLREDEA